VDQIGPGKLTRQIGKVKVDGKQKENCLNHIENDQSVELSGFGVQIEKQSHAERAEPEREREFL
jgi:hypothetical protein